MLDNLYIQKFHEDKIEKYGSGNAQSMAWFSEEDQLKRFDILAQIADLSNSSVLDIGCGNGDLCHYLSNRFYNVSYYGIDIMPAFLDNAIEKNKDFLNASFYLGDFMQNNLPTTDYVVASGSLNYKNSNPDFIFNAIYHLFAHCHKALGFNLLSKTVNPDGILRTYSPETIITYCKTLSKTVLLKESYVENDFTIMMYK
ncbi:class I SAM-dependent methyltransferase [Flavobacterium sp. MC2016-06]|jgi:trans-aconitate methyltransferase|uniref:class I SAM-dependent methyltransferase n=1 Tax=Flavobacterium sp. MC2016-06 TaxID=2676308 RepID=UPI0012BA5EB1|nr:class I SAM-dependent methyltransferase [Flavobacterium sp. MC2016-06]MBU3857573.1 class I SAM-dependent methyltransferase [Flavobacterium sp. MC2016-06]